MSDMPVLSHEDDYDENHGSSDEEAWQEEDENGASVRCLFCSNELKSVELAIDHANTEHKVDLIRMKTTFGMDQYSFIKLVNYIRTNATGPEVFRDASSCFWDDEKYLKPVEFEEWLMFDFEGLLESDNHATVKSEKQQIVELLAQLNEKDQLLEQAAADMETLRTKFREIFEEKPGSSGSDTGKAKTIGNCVGSVPLQQDEGYFQTYSHYGIHHEMLSDEIRTSSYRDAILQNSDVFSGKNVLDLGCGTAILSMFASKAGAKQVISIDQSDIIYQAMDIVRKNNIDNITFVKGRLEDTEIPINKVDIIISEWMGYFLLFEGMLDSVIYARDNHLTAGGQLLPNRCNISLVGLGDEQRHAAFITFWNDVYGFDMSNLQSEVLAEASVEVCRAEYVLTTPNVIADFDLMTVDVQCPNFSYDFALSVTRAGKLTALVGYFDTFFELPKHIEFSTSPHATATHWKQVVFYMRHPQAVTVGQTIVGKFTCRRDRQDVRALSVTIEMNGITNKYNLN